MNELKKHIKEKSLLRCYLLFGEEAFIKKTYENKLKSFIVPEDSQMMNYDYMEGKAFQVSKFIDSAETMPFLNDKRLVFVKDSGIFQTGKSSDIDTLVEYLDNIPESTVVIFSEETVDKRSKIFKTISKVGHCAEFKTPQEKELVNWIGKEFTKNSIKATNGVIVYFIRTVGTNMEALSSEIQKLCAYKDFSGELLNSDIDAVCIKSLETKIFDLIGAMGNKKVHVALEIYKNIILMKESPLMVLAMISRQLRLILQCKTLSGEGGTNSEIAKVVGTADFVVRECNNQGRNFTADFLITALEKCLETDVNIKTGKIEQDMGVELLIILFASH